MKIHPFKALLTGTLFACAAASHAEDATPSPSPVISTSESDVVAVTSGTAAVQDGLQSGYLQRIASMLSLTDTQTAQIKTIVETGETQAKAILENSTLPQDQKTAQLTTLKATSLQQINTFLTPAQRQQLITFLHQFHFRHHLHHK